MDRVLDKFLFWVDDIELGKCFIVYFLNWCKKFVYR